MALIEQAKTAPERNCKRLVVLGTSKVGKTSIVSRFLENKYDDGYTPTVENFHRKVYKIRGETYKLDIFDTSGNHPFQAMRRLLYITGDVFIIVYSIGSRESFDEAARIHNQIIECKSQSITEMSMILVGNKCDLEQERVIDQSEPVSLLEREPQCSSLESSAKENINIEEIFYKLFSLSKLPEEMNPARHRKVTPSYVGGSRAARGLTCLRRKVSEACGVIAPNVRRPSIRTDLRVAEVRTNASKMVKLETKDTKCNIQ